MRSLFRILIIAFVLVVHLLPAQPLTLLDKKIVFSRLPQNLGLSQSSINDILQDRDGYLWIATWSGLIRYDGYSTKIFHSGNGESDLRGNLVSCLFEDHEGKLWIGTHVTGLYQYDKKTNRFTNYQHGQGVDGSISNNNIWKIAEDENHNLWIGTENGLNFFDRAKQTFTVFRNEPGNANSISDNFVTDIFIASDKALWVATNFGINRLTQSDHALKVQRYSDPVADPAGNFVYEIVEFPTPAGREIWFITKKGLKCLKDNTITTFVAGDKPSNFSLYRKMLMIGGARPSLLLGSAMGLSFFDLSDRKFRKHITNADAFLFNNGQSMAVTSICIDDGGVLWVGTKKGLFKSDSYRKGFDLFLTSSFDLTNSIITGIRPAGEGCWISTIGGGLFYFDGKVFSPVSIPVKTGQDFAPFIQSLFTDSRGNVWAGTAGAGVIVLRPDRTLKRTEVVQHFHTTSSPRISDDYIMSFAEDSSGSVWIGTWNGNLIEINSNSEVINYDAGQFGNLPVVTLLSDKTGTIWAGSRGGGVYTISKRKSGTVIHNYVHVKGDSSGLTNNFINAIYQDGTGMLWFATEGGLIRFDHDRRLFVPVHIPGGPSNRGIVGLLDDEAGKLWLSHWNGITMMDPRDATGASVRNFDTHDHIQGGFFYNNVCLRHNGKLYFGGSDGLNVIHPGSVTSNPVRPNVILTDFRLFNQPVSAGERVGDRVVLEEPVDVVKSITLNYDQSTVSFEFAALDFAAPVKIRYAYKLEGVDKDWNFTAASRRYANYTNLGEGTYTFRVKSTNNDGIWNSSVAQVEVIVLPPWWRTVWAYGAYVIFTMLLLYLFRKLTLIRANFIHDIRYERLERENMENLNRAKLQFFTNISHEFRTPLTLILGPVQNLMESGGLSKSIRDQLHTINNNAQRLLRLVNQLLDFRKAESGNLRLQVSEGNLVRFVKEIKLSFDGLAEQMKVKFLFNYSAANINVWFDRDQFEKILFNLLSNAFKHTTAGGIVRIDLTDDQDRVTLSVTNSGRGIKPEHFDQIFQTFFSYDEDRHSAGTGIGLALVRSLVDAHHGTITVDSSENELTRFSIALLKGREHFGASEISAVPEEGELVAGWDPVPGVFPVNEPEAAAVKTEGLPTILIVEDNPEVRNYVRSIFVNDHIVLEAENGRGGLELALSEVPDLIISDIMMPVMDGIKFCRELKSDLRTSHIPVILLTARTSLIFKVEGLETGADDYVNKPFNPRLLQLKVRNLLRTRAMMRKLFTDNETLRIEPRRVTLNSTDELFLKKVLDSVERNMSSPDYSVEVLGDDVAMSRMQLYRKLKALTGQSAVEFIRTIRLKRAAQLLEQNQLTVAEVTYEVGFADLQYFRECFKKQFGMTPIEYAQRAQGQFADGEAG